MKRIFLFLLLILLASNTKVFSQATFISITNGNWNDNGTWNRLSGSDEDGVPDANDTVRIAVIQTDTVTIPANYAGICAALEVGSQFTNGAFLRFTDTTSTLTVGKCTMYQSPNTESRIIDIGLGKLTVTNDVTFNAPDTTSNHKLIILISSGSLTVGGNIVFNTMNASNAILDLTTGPGSLNLGGSFILDSVGTISTAIAGSIVNYNGDSAQTVVMDIPGFTYENLYINNTSVAGATLNGDITPTNVTGNLKIHTGTLSTATFLVTGNGGKSLIADSGATFVIGVSNSTQTFPTGFGTVTLDPMSTVKYGGGNQSVTNLAGGYGNLSLQSGVGATTKTMPGGAITIVGSLSIDAGIGTSISVSANGNITVGKNVVLGTGSLVNFGTYSHSVGGNWVNNGGLFGPGQSTITFNGNAAQLIAGPTFYNLTFSGSGIKKASSALSVSGTLTINNSSTFNDSTFDITVQKDWVNNGTFLSAGKVTFNGSSAQSINPSPFYNVAFSNGGLKTPTASLTVTKNFTINTGATVDGQGLSFLVGGNWTGAGTLLSTNSTVTFNGTDTQYVAGGTFNDFVINKTSGPVILTANAAVAGNFTLTSGTFDASSDTIDRTTFGGTFTMGNNTLFKIGGANRFPQQFQTLTFATTSTIEYSGSNQSLTLTNYKNLVLSGTGIKTVGQNINITGNVTVQSTATIDPSLFIITGNATDTLYSYGTLRIPQATLSDSYTNFGNISLKTGNSVEYSGGNQTVDSTVSYYGLSFSGSGTKTFSKGLTLPGNFNIDGVTVQGGAFSYFIAGNWNVINAGTFISTGLVTFNGAAQNISASTFNNIALGGTGVKYFTGNETVSGTITILGGATLNAGSYTHSLQGNFVNSGNFNDSTSTLIFNGTQTQLIGTGTFYNVTINNTLGASLTKSMTIADSLLFLNGTLTTNADSVILGATATLLEAPGKVVVGRIRTSRILLQNVTNTFGGIGLEISVPLTTPGQTVVSRKTGNAYNGSGTFVSHSTIKRYFDVSTIANTNLNATVTFHYDTSEINSQNEEKLSLWRSTNNGSTWMRHLSTADTTAKTIVSTGIPSLNKFSAADSANTLTAVTITIRNYSDPDGLVITNTGWKNKKWNLELHQDSINGPLLSSVLSDSVLSLSNLPEGTYVAVEADSANWKHIGYRLNLGTPVSDSVNNFISVSPLSGETKTIEFLNFIPNTITIKSVRDQDLKFTTATDRVAKNWKLYLFKTSVNPANVIDSVDSDTMLVRSNLSDGTYIAKQVDSAGWVHLGYTLDSVATVATATSVSVTLSSGQSRNVTFVNKYPAKIALRSYRDTDGDTATSADRILKKWSMKLYKDTISVDSSSLIKSTKGDTVLNSGDLADGRYIAVQVDSSGNWRHLSIMHDSTQRVGTFNTDTIDIVGGQTKTIKFINFNANNITIRAYEDLDGDISSTYDHVSQYWNLKLYKDSLTASKLLQEVSSDTQIVALNLGDGKYYAVQHDSAPWTNLRTLVTSTPPISVLSDTITLTLTGGNNPFVQFLHYKPENTKFRTFTQTDYTLKSVKIKVKKGLPVPLPNAGNVRDTAFAKLFSKKAATFGLDKSDSAVYYGWLSINTGNTIRSALPHTGTPRGLDSIGTKRLKPILKKIKSIKPTMHNNKLLGELITLKTNIAASDASITNNGLGDLMFYDSLNVTNPANNKTLRAIGTTVDTLLTFWKRFPASPLYLQYSNVLDSINHAFAGTMETLRTSPLKIAGVKSVRLIPFLTRVTFKEWTDTLLPYIAIPNPKSYDLFQNYPNPFNPTTVIPFRMYDDGFVTVRIYNILGEEVASAINNEYYVMGTHEVEFDGTKLASGMYFYRLFVNGITYGRTVKMVLIK